MPSTLSAHFEVDFLMPYLYLFKMWNNLLTTQQKESVNLPVARFTN